MMSGWAEPPSAQWCQGKPVRSNVWGAHARSSLSLTDTSWTKQQRQHMAVGHQSHGGCGVARGKPLSSPRAGRAQASMGAHHTAGIPHWSLVPGQWHRKGMPSPLLVAWFQGWTHYPILPHEPMKDSYDSVARMAHVSGPACRGSRRALRN